MGAGGHAKEMLELVIEEEGVKHVAVFDNVTPDIHIPKIFSEFNILRDKVSLTNWFKDNDNDFVIGVGGIRAKSILWELAMDCGGSPRSLIAKNAAIGHFDTNIGVGSTIMQMAFVSNSVQIGKGVLINTRVNIHHDIRIGDFCEIAPNALLLGRAQIGQNNFIGAGAVILPDIVIGNDCTIGAGAVVTKNLTDNMLVKGNPAR